MNINKTFGANTSEDFGGYFSNTKPLPLIKKYCNYVWRFPGGTEANFYNLSYDGAGHNATKRGNDLNFALVDKVKRDLMYKGYYGYNYTSNIIWPFINNITANRTQPAEAKLVLNLMNHYRSYTGYKMRGELIANYKWLDKIVSITSLMQSIFANTFWFTVLDNLQVYKILTTNGVTVNTIELSNESYMAHRDFTSFKTDMDGVIWDRDTELDFSMNIFVKLCAMYVRLFKELNPNLKFGIPMATEDGGGHAAYNAFLKKNKSVIGYDYEVKHLYGEKISMDGISVF